MTEERRYDIICPEEGPTQVGGALRAFSERRTNMTESCCIICEANYDIICPANVLQKKTNAIESRYGIIAVDFDGTLCEDCYPEIGKENRPLIAFLKEQQRGGAKLILWTCRCGEALREAVFWCMKHGIFFDAINANVPENILQYGSDSRKIYADIYIDDRARCWSCQESSIAI